MPTSKKTLQKPVKDDRFADFDDEYLTADDAELSNEEEEEDLSNEEEQDKEWWDALDLGLEDKDEEDEGDEQEQEGEEQEGDTSASNKAKKKKPLNLSKIQKFTQDVSKTGVVYLSRIPPFMKPIKVKQLLQQYGQVGRVYLAPEDERIAARRKKYRGNKRKNFTEGWVEFLDKKDAKKVALMLNNRPIGGKKRGYYHDDIWNIKYLSGFKWIHLQEQVAYERKVREQKMRVEMSAARKEVKELKKNVEKAKMIESIQERKRKRANEDDQDDHNDDNEQDNNHGEEDSKHKFIPKVQRKFKQRRVATDKEDRSQTIKPQLSATLLNKIFA